MLSYVLGSHNFELVLLDHGLYRTLNDTFRLEYAHLWDAIIRSDEPEIEEYSYRLFTHNERVTKDGVDHHRLFASMLTGRSWEVISSGGVATQRTDEEMGMISSKVSQGRFMVAIADILAKLPTELLMVLKTNDLLRAVDESLGVGKTSQEHMVRMVSTMGWYCAWAIWDHSAQSYSTFRWFRPAYYADFLHFMKAGVRLWGLKAVIVFQGWKYWFFSSSSIQSGHSV